MNVKPAYLRRLAAKHERSAASWSEIAAWDRDVSTRREYLRRARRENLYRVALLRWANELEQSPARKGKR